MTNVTPPSDMDFSHLTPVNVFDLRVEPEFTLTESYDPAAHSYIKYLAKHEGETLKQFRFLGKDGSRAFFDEIKSLSRSNISREILYEVSSKNTDCSNGKLLPSRVWAKTGGVQSTWCVLRNSLLSDTFDIDQKSSWLSCLALICKQASLYEFDTPDGKKKLNIPHASVLDWIQNKDEHVTTWMCQKDVSKKCIKTKLASCANGARFKTGYEPFANLCRELDSIEKQLHKIPPFKAYSEYCKQKLLKTKKNQTLVGFLTQAVEASISCSVLREFQKLGHSVACVVHDGMNVVKGEYESSYYVQLANVVSRILSDGFVRYEHKEPDFSFYDEKTGNETGQFTVKVVSEKKEDDEEWACACGCSFTKEELEKIPIKHEESYAGVKEAFECHYCQIDDEFVDEYSDAPNIRIKTHGSMRITHKCKKYLLHKREGDGPVSIHKYKFFDRWDEDENKRMYRKSDSYPDTENCPTDVFNLWQGYSVFEWVRENNVASFSDKDVRDAALWFRHAHRLIDDKFRDFLMEWICHMIRYPEVKPQILIGLLGDKRIGKGQFLEAVTNIVGSRYYCQTSNPSRDIWGDIGTDFCRGMQLCRLAEPSEKEYRDGGGKWRVWVTDDRVNIRAMRNTAETIRNFTRFIHDGNDPVLPDEEKGGRVAQTLCSRYWKEKYEGDEEAEIDYNTRLGQAVSNKSALALITFVLLRCGCPKRFNHQTISRVTGAFAAQQKKKSLDWFEQFLVYLADQHPWTVNSVQFRETTAHKMGDTKHTQSLPSLEEFVSNWSEYCAHKYAHTHFQVTRRISDWISMQRQGVKKERFKTPDGGMTPRIYTFDLKYIRDQYRMNEELTDAVRIDKDGNRLPRTIESYCELTESKCTCCDNQCQLNDDDLLQECIDTINDLTGRENGVMRGEEFQRYMDGEWPTPIDASDKRSDETKASSEDERCQDCESEEVASDEAIVVETSEEVPVSADVLEEQRRIYLEERENKVKASYGSLYERLKAKEQAMQVT